ncbi:hypothetical protein IV203_010501 [Nitzschia inconspicua]|uniref:Uncharacterized protein n=1 Tax=Nitzschia inconspicua TaxID=303405 RepID=A0A9K3KX02_9STRA|nr:hypothetical protein IV203_010501 [Nitzschia inconspicua]
MVGQKLVRPPRTLLSLVSPIISRIHSKNRCQQRSVGWLFCRGGSDSHNELDGDGRSTEKSDVTRSGNEDISPLPPTNLQPKAPHTPDVIRELDQGLSNGDFNEDSLVLRDLVISRTEDYLQELQEAVAANDKKLPHPRKLLHYLAPKVPAIRQSPDVNLRIHSSRSDIDAGVAACIISNLAQACEMYDKETLRRASQPDPNDTKEEKPKSVAPGITKDRRFEQLVECVISGVNVQKRKAEYLQRQLEKSTDEAADIEEVLDEEKSQIDEGLNIRDSCRAAWGMSVLGAHHLESIGGVNVNDLLLTLSLRIRELLLARLQLLRQDDILNDEGKDTTTTITTEERLSEISEELAKDAATAMWAFACVRACTGMPSPPLFEACCSLLCQDPFDLRRRAQEAANYEPGNPNIGSSDIIDRLARSEELENEEEEKNVNMEEVTVSSDRDVLLSWLSPTEVNDVLWSLALHGSNATALDDEITLSDTAATLREIAYDRMLGWLETDLKRIVQIQSPPTIEQSLETSLGKKNEESVTLEVVDAAALLASHENPASSRVPAEARTVPVENFTVHTNTLVRSDGTVQEVEVVDAATLLAAANNHEDIEVETEVIIAPVSVTNSNTVVTMEDDEGGEATIHEEYEQQTETPRFSPHDLASIAWSVTELRDPLKENIVGLVIEIFAKLGYDALFLSGADLSNLAWAIAKYEGASHNAERFLIMQGIAEYASRIRESNDLLGIFQPPELGRLLWAMASVFSTHTVVPCGVRRTVFSSQLASKALQIAANNLSLFATEDLVRIAWAFLEIANTKLSDVTQTDIKALGQILATTELSLQRWERGECGTESTSPGSHSDGSVFSSFFGRPRMNLPILDLVMGGDEEDDGESAQASERAKRPKLKDLSVDPSTLCKASCNFQRLSATHPYIKGGWTMTRVAVRLLSSKNGRLMRECSIHDLVRLCEATVLGDVDGHGRELIIGLFARQVVATLNDALERKTTFSLNFDSGSPSEMATLIWSLGELGVRLLPSGVENHSASKRMRLVSLNLILSKIEVAALDLAGLNRLVRGLVLMKAMPQALSLFPPILERISELLPEVENGSELCDIAASLGLVKEAMAKPEHGEKKSGGDDVEESSSDSTVVAITKEETEKDNTARYELNTAVDGVLDSIGSVVQELCPRLTAKDIRRILEVYSLLPFQADDMVDAIANEVVGRLSAIEELSKNRTLDDLLADAKQKSAIVKSTLYEEADKSFLDSIKSGFLSLFGSNNDEQKEDEEEPDERTVMTERIASMIQDSVATTSKAAERAQAEESILLTTLDESLLLLREEVSFELGQCVELIENYRRIEFSTGKRRSRYDRDRRNDIAKRVLSRLFP